MLFQAQYPSHNTRYAVVDPTADSASGRAEIPCLGTKSLHYVQTFCAQAKRTMLPQAKSAVIGSQRPV